MPVIGPGQFVRERFLPGARAVSGGAQRRFLGPRASSLIPAQLRGGGTVSAPGRQLSGNQSLLRETGTDRVVGAEELDFGVDPVQLPGREQFRSVTDLFLSQEQQGQLEKLSRTAAGRGIRGGALQSQLQGATDKFLAINRTQNFANVAAASNQAVGEAQAAASPFLAQLEQLRGAFDVGGSQALQVGQAGAGNLRQFARPLIEALAGLGQSRALVAGLTGDDISRAPFRLTGQEQQIANAVQQFLNPGLTQAQQRQAQSARSRFGRGPARARQAVSAARELSGTRLQAGEFLARGVQQPLSQANVAAAQLAGGAANISSLLAASFAAGGRGQPVTQADLGAEFGGAFGQIAGGFGGSPGQFRVNPLRFDRRIGFTF